MKNIKKKAGAKWSSSEIERLYRMEKTKIQHSAQHLAQEKLKAHLRLMDKHRHFLQGKINRQIPQIDRLNVQLRQYKKKRDLLSQKAKKISLENSHDLKILHSLDSRRKKMLSKIKRLALKK
jgi:hypothetical protein